LIHYNTYPLTHRPAEEKGGAIDPSSKKVSDLFQASRTKDPASLIQVNHPRHGTIGYFNTHKLDPEQASSARQGFDLTFDVLEIFNGPQVFSRNSEAIRDWFNLLNRGYYFPAVASSDTHGIDTREPGYARTYVQYDGKKGPDLDVPLLIEAVKAGRSFISNGPLLFIEVNGRSGPGDLCTSKKGKVDVLISVRCAPWIDVSEIHLVLNGKREFVFDVKDSERGVRSIKQKVSLRLDRDTWIAAEVLGKKSLYPVQQRAARNGEMKNAVLPYALTNPVFVDVDGNNEFDPPLKKEIEIKEK
jgi:hypothetical protein